MVLSVDGWKLYKISVLEGGDGVSRDLIQNLEQCFLRRGNPTKNAPNFSITPSAKSVVIPRFLTVYTLENLVNFT